MDGQDNFRAWHGSIASDGRRRKQGQGGQNDQPLVERHGVGFSDITPDLFPTCLVSASDHRCPGSRADPFLGFWKNLPFVTVVPRHKTRIAEFKDVVKS
jgi:hypothetical protein